MEKVWSHFMMIQKPRHHGRQGQDILINQQLLVLMEIKLALKAGAERPSLRRHKCGGLASIISLGSSLILTERPTMRMQGESAPRIRTTRLKSSHRPDIEAVILAIVVHTQTAIIEALNPSTIVGVLRGTPIPGAGPNTTDRGSIQA